MWCLRFEVVECVVFEVRSWLGVWCLKVEVVGCVVFEV